MLYKNGNWSLNDTKVEIITSGRNVNDEGEE